jgi:uncharacterized membrane protein HdeD (DUF308 family)
MSNAPVFVGVHQLRHNWGWFVFLGFLLIIIGCVALSYNFIASVVAVFYFGCLLLVTGIMEAASILFVRKWDGYFMHLLMGILDIVVGIIIIRQPAEAAIALTMVIAAFLVVGGIYRTVTAISLRFPHWGFAVFSGIISLLLGIMLWSQWPISGLWFIGMAIGIDMIFRGTAWISLGLRLKRVPAV